MLWFITYLFIGGLLAVPFWAWGYTKYEDSYDDWWIGVGVAIFFLWGLILPIGMIAAPFAAFLYFYWKFVRKLFEKWMKKT